MNNGQSESMLHRSVAGVRRDFTFAGKEFLWEATAVYGENTSTFFGNAINQQNFINALNVAQDSTGNITCTTAAVPGLVIPGGGVAKNDPKCVPLNLFGEGAPSAEAKAYVTSRTQAKAKIEQQILNTNIGGSLFNLPAGSVAFNAGFETRREAGQFVPDEFLTQGLGRAVAILGNSGSYRTKELFGEVVLPVISPKLFKSGEPSLSRLDITGKFRQVDNEINGKANTHTVGLQFRPVSVVEIRGNRTSAIRAPSVTELFTPTSNIFSTVPDPCDSRNVASGTRPETRKANCDNLYKALGINGSTFLSTAVSATIPGTLSGSDTLLNERSTARNIGLLLFPAKDFRLSFDRFEIDIKDTISNLNASAIATGCFDNFEYPNPFCERIVRDATGQITGIKTGFVNGGVLKYRGGAFEAVYSSKIPETSAFLAGARFDVGINLATLQTFETSTNKVVVLDSAGQVGYSRKQAQFVTGLTKDRLSLSLTGSYIGSARIDNYESAEQRDIVNLASPFPSYMLWGGGASYRITERLSVRLAVANLFDKNPPFPMGSGLASGIYDLLGRRFSIGLSGRI
jgi:hypothetical protein